MEQRVLLLRENHEVVVAVVSDLVERVEVVLKEVPVVSKSLVKPNETSSSHLE